MTVERESPAARVLTASRSAGDASALFDAVAGTLRRYVPWDAAPWRTLDPATGLMTETLLVENLPADGCDVYWESELLGSRVNGFDELARAAVPADALAAQGPDAIARSSVYRRHLRPNGLADELRAVLRASGRPWGAVSLFRSAERPSFSAHEVRLLAQLTAPLGERLRALARPTSAPAHLPGPGVLLFDARGALVSISELARAHLATLPAPSGPAGSRADVPPWLRARVWRARAGAGRTCCRRGRSRPGCGCGRARAAGSWAGRPASTRRTARSTTSRSPWRPPERSAWTR
jgi:hypothetical protein